MKRRLIIGVIVAAVIACVAVVFILWEPHPGGYDERARSNNLQRDISLMWQTTQMRNADQTHGPDPHASTDRAINAASRVFNTVELVGKSRKDVINLLGDPQTSSNSTYNFPFWPRSENDLVYRFDCGAYGWQFNVSFDERGMVKEVERMWIH